MAIAGKERGRNGVPHMKNTRETTHLGGMRKVGKIGAITIQKVGKEVVGKTDQREREIGATGMTVVPQIIGKTEVLTMRNRRGKSKLVKDTRSNSRQRSQMMACKLLIKRKKSRSALRTQSRSGSERGERAQTSQRQP